MKATVTATTAAVDRRAVIGGAVIGIGAAAMLAGGVKAAPTPAGFERFAIWPGEAPGGERVTVTEEEAPREAGGGPETNQAAHIRRPSLTVIRPARPNGAALLILPGGGYRRLSTGREGYAIGRRFAEHGITCFVLLYRMPGDGWAAGPDAPLQDAQRALRVIRAQAAKYGVDAKRVAALGFSAGGHLCARLATQADTATYPPVDAADALSARPDLAALLYPVITLADPLAHAGSRQELLGATPSADRIARWSAQTGVSAATPPVFLAHAIDDKTVPYDNSLMFLSALRSHNVPSELHLFESGGHGFALALDGAPAAWPDLLLAWSRRHGLVA